MRNINRFSIGAVLTGSFGVLFGNLASFIPLSIIAYSPVWIGLLVFGPQSAQEPFSGTGPIMLLLSMIGSYWLQAALIYGTISSLRGSNSSLGEMLSRSLQALLAVIVVAVLLSVLISIGFLLLIIPGLFLMTMFWVAIPVAVVERNGIGAAFTRSRELTSGHRWPVFGLFLIVVIIMVVVNVVVGLIFGFAGAAAVSSVGMWVTQFFGMCVAAFWSVVVAVSYHDLRVVKEGVGTEQIAQVFD